ncbi:MAG: hypothetical protein ACXWJ4_11705, partial [Methyloceanibacter sp.]
SDPARTALRANFLDFISPASVNSLPSALSYLGTIFFGVGTGLTAYDRFGMGTHMAYFDLMIGKGIVGLVLLALSLALLVIGIVRDTLAADVSNSARRHKHRTLPPSVCFFGVDLGCPWLAFFLVLHWPRLRLQVRLIQIRQLRVLWDVSPACRGGFAVLS